MQLSRHIGWRHDHGERLARRVAGGAEITLLKPERIALRFDPAGVVRLRHLGGWIDTTHLESSSKIRPRSLGRRGSEAPRVAAQRSARWSSGTTSSSVSATGTPTRWN